jgi:hypothetical protein
VNLLILRMVDEMPSTLELIISELKEKHKIDEFFYPDISMNIQIPDGLKGEISEITQLLEKNHLEANSENVYQVMKFKKKLLTEYKDNNERRKVFNAYQELLEKKVKPIGSAIPLELTFVDGILLILLYMVVRFGTSFLDEAGKITARKLLDNKKDNEKKQAKRHNMTVEEYSFLKTEAVTWVEEGKTFRSFVKKIRKKKKGS